MCGRYASFREAEDLADHFAVSPAALAEDARRLPASWNVAPTDPVRIVVERGPRKGAAPESTVESGVVRSLRLARWGLVPGWAKDPKVGARMINARTESLVEKPAFRRAAAHRRCIVPAEGYYEWRRPAPGAPKSAPKQPFWIHAPDGSPLAFAGLYEFWRDPTRSDDDPDRWLVTTTIITGAASAEEPELAAIHDRRPAVLGPDLWAGWLDPDQQDAHAAVELLHEPTLRLVATQVSTAVNKVGTDGPQLLAEVELDGSRTGGQPAAGAPTDLAPEQD